MGFILPEVLILITYLEYCIISARYGKSDHSHPYLRINPLIQVQLTELTFNYYKCVKEGIY